MRDFYQRPPTNHNRISISFTLLSSVYFSLCVFLYPWMDTSCQVSFGQSSSALLLLQSLDEVKERKERHRDAMRERRMKVSFFLPVCLSMSLSIWSTLDELRQSCRSLLPLSGFDLLKAVVIIPSSLYASSRHFFRCLLGRQSISHIAVYITDLHLLLSCLETMHSKMFPLVQFDSNPIQQGKEGEEITCHPFGVVFE